MWPACRSPSASTPISCSSLRTSRIPVDIDDFHEIYKRCYKGSNIVKISDLTTDETNGLFLNANKDAGKDSLTIYIAGNDDRILVLASFDNLGKGASGAAIECMNIMLGFPARPALSSKQKRLLP